MAVITVCDGQKGKTCQIFCHGKYTSEEERGQVGHESRSKEAADDAHAHAKGPCGDLRLLQP